MVRFAEKFRKIVQRDRPRMGYAERVKDVFHRHLLLRRNRRFVPGHPPRTARFEGKLEHGERLSFSGFAGRERTNINSSGISGCRAINGHKFLRERKRCSVVIDWRARNAADRLA